MKIKKRNILRYQFSPLLYLVLNELCNPWSESGSQRLRLANKHTNQHSISRKNFKGGVGRIFDIIEDTCLLTFAGIVMQADSLSASVFQTRC